MGKLTDNNITFSHAPSECVGIPFCKASKIFNRRRNVQLKFICPFQWQCSQSEIFSKSLGGVLQGAVKAH